MIHISEIKDTANNIDRGSRFTLSRDELLTLPEFVLLSLFPNGLLPDGHMNSYHDGDVYPVDVSSNTFPCPTNNADSSKDAINAACDAVNEAAEAFAAMHGCVIRSRCLGP